MNNYDYEITKAYTLGDICEPITGTTYYGVEVPKFSDVCTYYGVNLGNESADFSSGERGFNLWRAIFIKFKEHFIIINDNADNESVKPWLRSFVNIYARTSKRYSVILLAYEQQEEHLLDQIKTSSTNEARFNDTPQQGQDYGGDSYTSNITKSKSESRTDVMTPIQRLKEIESGYNDLIAEWTDEFSGLFIEEGNV